MSTVWYLIVAFYANGGVAVIPQASREACTAQVSWMLQHSADRDEPLYASCVYGIPTQVVQR